MDSECKPLEGLHELVSKTITYNTTVLGRGSYAAVYKAKCRELPCAVKILHSIFQEDPNVGILAESFNRECEYLKNIRHPNIVQYLGLCRDPQTHHPALLMELMDQSLTRFLESSSDRLAPRIEVSICHDTALALAHLHSIGIVHRDLSSNNVLLIGAGSRAKVCDFGMSKVIDARYSRYSSTPQLHSKCPGTVAYMPPEALVELPGYTKKLDCFSFGVLSIQIMTRLFPNPTARTKMIESPLSLTGMVIVPVLETECRKDHIDMIDQLNPLLPVAIRCLALKKEERPSAYELCELMEEVRRNITDEEQIPKPSSSTLTTNAELETIRRNHEEEIAILHQQLEEKQEESDAQLAKVVATKRDLEEEVEQLHQSMEESLSVSSVHAKRCAALEEIKRNQEETLSSLYQKLDNKMLRDSTQSGRCGELDEIKRYQEETISSLQQKLKDMLSRNSLQSERCRELEGMYRKKEEKMTSLQKELEERLSVNYIQSEKCAELEKANQKQKQEIANLLQQLGEKLCTDKKPDGVVPKPLTDRPQPSSLVETHRQLESHLPIKHWLVGIPAPSSLAKSSSVQFSSTANRIQVFCGIYTSVYCFNVQNNNWMQIPTFRYTDFANLRLFVQMESGTLYALKDNEMCHFLEGKWIRDKYLVESEGRFACTYYNGYIILVSHNTLKLFLLTGEILAKYNSPALQHPSISIANKSIYLVGGQVDLEWTNKVFSAKLRQILHIPGKTVLDSLNIRKSKYLQWQEIAPLPVSHCTSVSFNEHLIAVGGYNSTTGEASNQIFVYSEPQNKWDVIGFIPTARYGCVVEVVGNKLVVIGGWLNQFTKCDIVEVGTINI